MSVRVEEEAEFIQEPRGIHAGEKEEGGEDKAEERDPRRERTQSRKRRRLGGWSQFSDALQHLILALHLQGKSPSSYLNQESGGWGREGEFAP